MPNVTVPPKPSSATIEPLQPFILPKQTPPTANPADLAPQPDKPKPELMSDVPASTAASELHPSEHHVLPQLQSPYHDLFLGDILGQTGWMASWQETIKTTPVPLTLDNSAHVSLPPSLPFTSPFPTASLLNDSTHAAAAAVTPTERPSEVGKWPKPSDSNTDKPKPYASTRARQGKSPVAVDLRIA